MESIILKTTTLSDITAFFMIYLQSTSALRTKGAFTASA